jgi:hypothetical protein
VLAGSYAFRRVYPRRHLGIHLLHLSYLHPCLCRAAGYGQRHTSQVLTSFGGLAAECSKEFGGRFWPRTLPGGSPYC